MVRDKRGWKKKKAGKLGTTLGNEARNAERHLTDPIGPRGAFARGYVGKRIWRERAHLWRRIGQVRSQDGHPTLGTNVAGFHDCYMTRGAAARLHWDCGRWWVQPSAPSRGPTACWGLGKEGAGRLKIRDVAMMHSRGALDGQEGPWQGKSPYLFHPSVGRMRISTVPNLRNRKRVINT